MNSSTSMIQKFLRADGFSIFGHIFLLSSRTKIPCRENLYLNILEAPQIQHVKQWTHNSTPPNMYLFCIISMNAKTIYPLTEVETWSPSPIVPSLSSFTLPPPNQSPNPIVFLYSISKIHVYLSIPTADTLIQFIIFFHLNDFLHFILSLKK